MPTMKSGVGVVGFTLYNF